MQPEKPAQIQTIVVSATSIDNSGGGTILRQFLKWAAKDKHNYLCFVPLGMKLDAGDNIRLVPIDKKSWLARILWDAWQLKSWLKNNQVTYHKFISLQDTTVNIDADQIIYLHQPLPFAGVSWNPLVRGEFKFFLYQKFFAYFIFRYLGPSTVFVVQTRWMSRALSENHAINPEKIRVIQPEIVLPDTVAPGSSLESKDESFSMLYPATPLVYKNHRVLVEALAILSRSMDISTVRLEFTLKAQDYPELAQLVKKLGLENNINYLGVLPYEQLIIKYRAADLVVFPSYIETFGLPLAEAASLGKRIICSDTEFAREVLNNYAGAEYLDAKNASAWASAIEAEFKSGSSPGREVTHFQYQRTSGWNDFFKLLE